MSLLLGEDARFVEIKMGQLLWRVYLGLPENCPADVCSLYQSMPNEEILQSD
jgi:hypothetical protein